jgi:UDPglucose 6-dehydrogenase
MSADVSVIGLGKLGLPLSVAFADRGISVIGVDNVPGVVEAVNARVPHIYEPKLQTFLNLAGDRLLATSDLHDAVQRTPISIVLVPTPSDDDGWFSLKYVLEVCAELGQAIRDKGRYHLVVISSTVMPGSCDGEIKAVLEKASRDKINKSWGLCYCPEFVALGDCIAGFKRPDFVLIGQSDKLAGDVLESLYIRFVPPGTPIERMALINAELAKISLNCYVTTKISFANQVAEICEKLPGADVDTVTNAIGNDKRIGKRYLRGATGFGGVCFPRDVRAMLALARKLDIKLPLPNAVNQINEWQIERLAYLVRVTVQRAKRSEIGILGLAFKPGTDVTTESTGMALARELQTFNLHTFDPVVEGNCESAQQCVDKSDVIIVTIPSDDFKALQFKRGQVVIDCWRILSKEQLDGAWYVPVGVGS